jgi:hypothetical protein
MDEERWVHCGYCGQTYAAGRGQRCSLCARAGGLRDVPAPPPSPNELDRATWAPGARFNGGVPLTGGCLGMLVGATLGVIITLGLPMDEVTDPAQGGAAGAECGTGAAIIGFGELVGRVVLGVTVGSPVGGLVGLVVLGLLYRLDRRSGTVRPEKAEGQQSTGPT